MYVITEGLGPRYKPLATLFCLAGVIGCLPLVQINQLVQTVREVVFIDQGWLEPVNSMPFNFVAGLTLATIVALVIFGGLARIAQVAGKLVPTMALLYIGSARGMVDERSIEALRQIRRDAGGSRMTLPEFKMLVREQFFMLLLDQQGALAAIPKMLPEDVAQRLTAFTMMRQVLSASGEITGERASRLQRIAALFGIDAGEGTSNIAPFDPKAKAS